MKSKKIPGIMQTLLVICTLTLALTFNVQLAKASYPLYTRVYLPNEWISDGVAMDWHADDNSWNYTLPFNFPFYGTYYGTIYVSSNGLITFTSPDGSCSNSISELAGKLAIAPAWDDWETYTTPHDIYIWQPNSTNVAIRWEVAALYDSTIAANFEAILWVDGTIQFNYGYNNGTISATAGISNGVDEILAEDIVTSNYIQTIVFTPFRPDHELDVGLDAKDFLLPGDSSLLNATVYNLGLGNETNVDLQLLINGTVVDSVTIPDLPNGTSHTLSYLWTPTVEAAYNVTAYAPPVTGENYTYNNIATKIVTVTYPLIHPIEGQWANYTWYQVDNGTGQTIGTGEMNFVYLDYISPYQINITTWIRDPGGYVTAGWMILNTMNRMVENDTGIGWAGMWYPGWIETNVTTGSMINLLDGTATVVGSQTVYALEHGLYPIDCWEVFMDYYGYEYTFWYDKTSGLWVSMKYTMDSYRFELTLTATNIPLIRHEHELAVLLDVPYHLEPGESSLLNATVYNLGLSNETDVELQLLMDDAPLNSTMILILNNGTSHTINYLWTPIVEATYNVTAYTPPILGENATTNNIMSRMVHVRSVEVALISDYSQLSAVTPILDSMGIGYDVYNDNNIYLYTEDLDLLLDYSAVIFYTDYRQITSAEYLTLQSYLSSGGNLLVTGYDCLVSDSLLADLVYSSSYGDNTGEPDLYVIDATHPIMNGPYGSFPAGYHISGLSSDCDAAEADTSQMAVTVAELADGYDKIIATDQLPGSVVYWNGVGPNDWTMNVDCEAMFKNMLSWFIIQYEHELAVSLDAPAFLEPSVSSLLNATVHNRGLTNETNVELYLLINGTAVNSTTIPELLTGASYTINYLWTPTVEATYNVTAYALPVPNETVTTNNIAHKMVPVRWIKGYILFDQTHGTDSITSYNIWVANLTERGYVVDTHTYEPITSSLLADYDVFVIPQARYSFSSTELSALRSFVSDGGGLIVIGNDYQYVLTDLTSFAGISWMSGGVSGTTTDITPHFVTRGVTSTYLDWTYTVIQVAGMAQDLVRDLGGSIVLAVSEYDGKVIGFANRGALMDYGIVQEDNLQLANNMIDWFFGPVASFTYSPIDPFMGETVTFNASSSYDPDDTIVSYEWDFGDGTTGTGITATHTYTVAGPHQVTLTVTDDDDLTDTSTKTVTVSRVMMNVEVDVGSVHFRGEMAEFYVLVSLLGEPVNAEISAILYFDGTFYANLTAYVENVEIGLYRVAYTIPTNAQTGTYALLVRASYLALKGTFLKSFLLSPTLTGTLISLNGTVAWIKTDVGIIKTDVADIELEVTEINGNIATIQTTLGTIEGRITSIEGNIATVETDIGTVKVDVSNVKGAQEAFATPLYITIGSALVAAVGAILAIILIRRKPKT